MIKADKLYYLIIGLIYPAVLGAYIYEGGTKAFEMFNNLGFCALFSTIFSKGLVVLLLFFHYIGDFLYTLDDDPQNSYSIGRFISDLLIILSMFIAFRVAFDNSAAWIIALVLLITKVCGVVWEKSVRSGLNQEGITGIILDSLFFVLYLPVLITLYIHPAPSNMALILVLIMDVLCYLFFDFLHTKLKSLQPLKKIYAKYEA